MQHTSLANGRWLQFTLMEQLAHVGSEVDRAVHWEKKAEIEHAQSAATRALELVDLTLADQRWNGRQKEIARTREVLCDHFFGENIYGTTGEELQRYFLGFGFFAALHR